MKKKLWSVMLAAALLSGGAAMAEEYVPPEIPGAWQEISVEDMDTLFFDASRCTYDPATDTAEVWMRTDTKHLKETYVTVYTIDFAAGKIHVAPAGWLYKNQKVRQLKNAVIPMDIKPNTYGEKLAKAVAAYVDRDAKLAAYRAAQNKA